MPKSLLVIGSGAIGIEFASFYDHMGAEVTVVEVLDRVLPVEDDEISALARKQFEKRGIKIHTGAKVSGARRRATAAVAARIEADGQAREIEVERVVLAIGITGNVESLGLEGTGVQVEKGHVVVDQWLQHRRARGLRDRRSRRAALARPQGLARGGDLRRADQGAERRPPAGCQQDPGLHLLHAAGGERRPERAGGAGSAGTRSRSGASPMSATARRSRSARPRGWSRRCSMPRPASCSAPT